MHAFSLLTLVVSKIKERTANKKQIGSEEMVLA